MKKILFISALSFLVISCGDRTEKDSEKITEEKSTTFDVTVEIKIKKDDDLILYYKDGSNEWIVEEKAVWNSVKGSNDFQKVMFKLPEDVVPNDFRFDIGRNEFKDQDPVEIRSFTISYYDNSFVVTQDMFNTFFKPNQYIKYDESAKQFSLNKVEGNYDPYFETAPEMYPQISKIVLNN
jgi:hypothetical protein